jgi:hypothetical protein
MSLATMIVSLALANPATATMSPTTIRIVAAMIFVVMLFVIVGRRKKMSARRKPIV